MLRAAPQTGQKSRPVATRWPRLAQVGQPCHLLGSGRRAAQAHQCAKSENHYRTTTVLPISGWMTYRAAYTQQRGGAPRALPSANTTWRQKGGASEWYVSEPAASPAQKCSRHVSGWAGSPTRCWAPRFPSPSFTFARNPQSFLVVRFPRQGRRAPDGPGLKQNMCPTFCLEA